MLPLFLNLTGKLAVVVGAGRVGRRKTQTLLNAGARVRSVSLEATIDLTHPHLSCITEPYCSAHLEGSCLVFAATYPALNRQIVADAKSKGVWVNSADDPEAGDFILPAATSCGSLQIAVSTGGAAPSLAARVRDRLALQFDEVFADWLKILAEFRPIILAAIADPAERAELFHRLTEWHWLDRLRHSGRESLLASIQSMVKAATKP